MDRLPLRIHHGVERARNLCAFLSHVVVPALTITRSAHRLEALECTNANCVHAVQPRQTEAHHPHRTRLRSYLHYVGNHLIWHDAWSEQRSVRDL